MKNSKQTSSKIFAISILIAIFGAFAFQGMKTSILSNVSESYNVKNDLVKISKAVSPNVHAETKAEELEVPKTGSVEESGDKIISPVVMLGITSIIIMLSTLLIISKI